MLPPEVITGLIPALHYIKVSFYDHNLVHTFHCLNTFFLSELFSLPILNLVVGPHVSF